MKDKCAQCRFVEICTVKIDIYDEFSFVGSVPPPYPDCEAHHLDGCEKLPTFSVYNAATGEKCTDTYFMVTQDGKLVTEDRIAQKGKYAIRIKGKVYMW